ncbi:MAG: hypothetical protein ACO1TE_06415 [Prosthecobacter sp.]
MTTASTPAPPASPALTSAETRVEILRLCEAWAAARVTGNALVQEAVRTCIEAVVLPRLIPDKPASPEVQG